jgi:aminopeptidase N
MKEAIAHYLCFLATWELYESKKDFTGYGSPDKSLYFFQMMEMETEMMKDSIQKPMYLEGRTFSESMNYIYERGAMIIRMLATTITDENFNKAMQSFVRNYYYRNVDHEQLWAEMEFANPFKTHNVSISDIFNTWIMQEGVPIVSVKSCQKNDTCKHQVWFQQTKYSSNTMNDNKAFSSLWYIPIHFAIVHFENGVYEWFPRNHDVVWFLIPNTTESVAYEHSFIPTPGSKSALLVNVNHTGMYHVTYDEPAWKHIGTILMEACDMVPVGTRRQLLWSLKLSLRRKEIKVSLFLCIAEYIQVIDFYF